LIVTKIDIKIAPLKEQRGIIVNGSVPIVEEQLAVLIRRPNLRKFTLNILLRHYSEQNTDVGCRKKLRAFLYNQIQKLVKHGFLTKEGEKYSRFIIYERTSLFNRIGGCEQGCRKPTASVPSFFSKQITKVLKDRLERQKRVLSKATGEMEEYRVLIDMLPSMKNKIQPFYTECKAKVLATQGAINALERVIESSKLAFPLCFVDE